jgi:translation initiation factor 2B subunit (eIF-2B alpha/beta/delta family)
VFDEYLQRVRRWPAALARTAATTLTTGLDRTTIRLVTLSASGSVVRVVEALRRTHEVSIACSESRPALEGRGLALELSQRSARVTFFTDAALAAGLDDADAVLTGADAVGPHALVNKAGTLMLAAAAALRGVPVYVAATRDKLAMPALWPHLAAREGQAEDVWDARTPGVTVRNPCFETVPVDLLTGVITDLGFLGAGMVADACAAQETPAMLAALERVLVGAR